MENDPDERINTGMRLTRAALAKVDAAGDRIKRSRAAVIEILINLHADDLNADTLIPAGVVPPNPGPTRRKTTKKGKPKSD